MIPIICTILMIAVVVFCVVKKFHVPTVFFAVSWIALLFWSLATGKSVLGDATVGNNILDIFEYTVNTIKTQLTGTVLICASIFGYVGFMNKIGASQAFTTLLAKPLAKIKQPYVLLGMLIVLSSFLKLVIPSAASLVALLFAILFPIFANLGCSPLSIASAFVLGTVITWGPADAGVALSVSLAGVEGLELSDFFMNYQFIPCVAEMVVMAIVFVLISIKADKKNNETVTLTEEQLRKQQEAMQINVPKFYAVLPLLPLILILLFSGKIFPITLSTIAVVLISILISDIVHVIVNRKTFVKTLGDVNADLLEVGGFIGRMGFIIIGGNLFAGAIKTIGGMNMIVEVLNGLGGGYVLLATIGVVLGLVIVACTGSYTANLNIIVPFLVSVANVTGVNPAAMAQLGNMACGLGSGLTPVSGTMLFVSGECKVDFPSVLKRNIIPIAAAAATGLVVTLMLYA